MTSLVGRVLARSLVVLVCALLAVGLVTGALLHRAEGRAADGALLAAATSYSQQDAWQSEHARSPVEVGWAEDLGARPEWISAVLATERPLWVDTGDRRVLLLLVEQEDAHERHDEHRVVLASAPRATLARTVGPFAAAYALAASLTALAAGALQRRLLRAAVEPLAEAVRSVQRASSAATGSRLAPRGPDEVRALLASVDELLVRRDDAFRAQARFSAVAAHELRTPLSVLLGELDLALRRPRAAAELADALTTAREETRRLVALVEGLLLLARVDAGQAEQGRTVEHLGAIVEAAVRRERAAVEGRGGVLRVEAGPDPEVEVNEALVVAALANLIRNAAVHAPGSTVTVRTEAREGAVAVVVADDGPGFRPAPSFERRPESGLGLGLPLSREVARRHGGDCLVVPTERGAAVSFVLPLWGPPVA